MNRRHCGFTLTELLVVISIIAVLASLLLPAVGMVQDMSRQMTCANNLRQITMAWIGYAQDNDGLVMPHQLPSTMWTAEHPDWGIWYGTLLPYVCEGQDLNGDWTYHKTFRCVSGNVREPFVGSRLKFFTGSYGLNASLLQGIDITAASWQTWGAWNVRASLTRLRHQSESIIFAERWGYTATWPSDAGEVFPPFFTTANNNINLRSVNLAGVVMAGDLRSPGPGESLKTVRAGHRGKILVSCVDGHVEALPAAIPTWNTSDWRLPPNRWTGVY